MQRQYKNQYLDFPEYIKRAKQNSLDWGDDYTTVRVAKKLFYNTFILQAFSEDGDRVTNINAIFQRLEYTYMGIYENMGEQVEEEGEEKEDDIYVYPKVDDIIHLTRCKWRNNKFYVLEYEQANVQEGDLRF